MSALVNVLATALSAYVVAGAAVEAAADFRLECPPVMMAEQASGGWAVLAQDGVLTVIATRWDEGSAVASYMSSELEPDDAAAGEPEPRWKEVARSSFGWNARGYLRSMTAMAADDGDQVYLVDERASGTLMYGWMSVPRSRFGASSGEGEVSARLQFIMLVGEREASPERRKVNLSGPALVSYGGELLLAGATRDCDVWIGPFPGSGGNTLRATFVGSGWAPAPVPTAEGLFCFAIYKAPRRYDDFSGSLVAWKSADAEQWEAWAPGVALDSVVRVDACTEGETTLVACLTAAPEPRIHVYRLDAAKEGLTEVLTVDPAPEGELGRDIAIRLLDGKAYLFYQDNVGDDPHALFSKGHVGNVKTFIVMRPLELPAAEE